MAKITLDTITSAYASTSLFQSNFSAIEDELNDKVLYRVNPAGEANQMMNDLDMNSNDILNVDALDTTSLTVNGTAITPNTNDQTLTYIDTEFTTQAGQDTFLAAYTVGFVDVYYNGVLMATADYTATNGTSVVLASTVVDNADVITVRAFSAFSAGDGITQATADARYLLEANNLSDLNSTSTSRTNLGLGTAATADVQTSATDTTADALMAVGAFGIGGRIISTDTDYDAGDYLIGGNYITPNTAMSNTPDDYSNGRHVIAIDGSELYITQTLYGASGVDMGKVWVRMFNSTSWSDWEPVYTGVNFQPDEVEGINARLVLQNNSGGTVNVGASVAGSSLNTVKWSSTMVPSIGGVYSGTYKNVTGQGINDTEIGIFVRTA
jgi:hypothetical protein